MPSTRRPRLVQLALVALVWLTFCAGAPAASAYTTRVHIVLANELRDQLVATNDGTIALRFGDHHVVLSAEDAAAIVGDPLAFRAGAIGPDNFVFPAMTDPSHAIHMRPFDQCESLYRAAVTGEERAYALGCFLHGSSDAVAHHLVNWLSGETFTTTPISAGRAQSWDNVIRHIVAEAMIQRALVDHDPSRFEQGQMLHKIPIGFVLRVYLETSSPLWQQISAEARAKLEAGLELAPAEHMVLLPYYLEQIDARVVALRTSVVTQIALMQSRTTDTGDQLRVTAGDDGVLGTLDDETACAVTCPGIYARYFTYVGLLAPRFDASGDPLPSAFDEVSAELRRDLLDFLPAYLQTVENISAALNTAVAPAGTGFDLGALDVDAVLAPMTTWVTDVTAVDFELLVSAVAPDWLADVQRVLQVAGVNVRVASIVEILFRPAIDEIRLTIEERIVGEASAYLNELASKYQQMAAVIEADYTTRLAQVVPAGASGGLLAHIHDSGLWGYSFNLVAAALANHDLVLPDGDEHGGHGPASFDASHTLAWTQAAACDYLREPIFPLGVDLRALLSFEIDGQAALATVPGDSPIECHGGSLFAFAVGTSEVTCRLTDLASLLEDSDHLGSLSRAYPPGAVGATMTCRRPRVPGLTTPDDEADTRGGCGCRAGGGAGHGGLVLALGVLAGLRRRRGRRRPAVAAAALLVSTLACGGDGGDGRIDVDAGGDGHDASNPRAALIAALGDSVWHGEHVRDGKRRTFELSFRAGSLLWAEVRNPFGPAHQREMRSFQVADDGTTVTSVVISPAGWPVSPRNGTTESFTFAIEGSPRRLAITGANGVEIYDEGPAPSPASGLTAIAKTFPSGGDVDLAFCGSGVGGIDYAKLLEHANATTGVTDAVAGIAATAWRDPSGGNNFALRDVPGFELRGGTESTAQVNFMIVYRGEVADPGAPIAMRELDDSVEDGVWVFLGEDVGSQSTADLFLEVHGLAWADLTPDVPQRPYTPGAVPIQAIAIRCTQPVEPVDLQLAIGGGPFVDVGAAPARPFIDGRLFPAAF